MTKERVIDILVSYIDNDLKTADSGYVREVLEDLCFKDELKELGLWDWLGFEDEELGLFEWLESAEEDE